MTAAARARARRSESGMVTAEAAVLAPVAGLCAALGVWVVSLGHLQVRLVDAARDAARLIARGEPSDAAVDAVRSEVPSGTTFDVTKDAGSTVTVRVTGRSRAPLPGLSWPMQAEATCVDES